MRLTWCRGVAVLLCAFLPAGCGAQRPAAPAASPSATPPSATPPAAVAALEVSPLPPAPAEIDVDRALEIDRVLSQDIGVRVAGTPEDDRATNYIASVFTGAGYRTERRAFSLAEGGRSHNVVARHPSADYSAGYLLIGGHHDTVPGAPGANDNGSGVAVILTVAEKLFKHRLPVEFVTFGAEERDEATRTHHEGSVAYAKALRPPGLVRAMLSVDMIANGPKLFLTRYRAGAGADLQREVAGHAANAGVPVAFESRGDISDHVPFAQAGIPAILVWTGDHPTKHKPGDTMQVVQPPALGRAGRLVLEWLRQRNGMAPLN